jgi:hypothetical protein
MVEKVLFFFMPDIALKTTEILGHMYMGNIYDGDDFLGLNAMRKNGLLRE